MRVSIGQSQGREGGFTPLSEGSIELREAEDCAMISRSEFWLFFFAGEFSQRRPRGLSLTTAS